MSDKNPANKIVPRWIRKRPTKCIEKSRASVVPVYELLNSTLIADETIKKKEAIDISTVHGSAKSSCNKKVCDFSSAIEQETSDGRFLERTTELAVSRCPPRKSLILEDVILCSSGRYSVEVSIANASEILESTLKRAFIMPGSSADISKNGNTNSCILMLNITADVPADSNENKQSGEIKRQSGEIERLSGEIEMFKQQNPENLRKARLPTDANWEPITDAVTLKMLDNELADPEYHEAFEKSLLSIAEESEESDTNPNYRLRRVVRRIIDEEHLHEYTFKRNMHNGKKIFQNLSRLTAVLKAVMELDSPGDYNFHKSMGDVLNNDRIRYKAHRNHS